MIDPTRRQAENNLAQIQRDQDERWKNLLADIESRVLKRFPDDLDMQTRMRQWLTKAALIGSGYRGTLAEQAMADQIEMSLRSTEIVDGYYDGPGRIVRALHWTPEELKPQISNLIDRKIRTHMSHFASGPDGAPPQGITHGNPPLPPELGISATLTSRLDERWPLVNDQAFADVIEVARNQPWCDLQMSGRGICISFMEFLMRNKMSGWNPIPIPFDVGSIIVIGSICFTCWDRFSTLYQLGDTSVGEPFDFVP